MTTNLNFSSDIEVPDNAAAITGNELLFGSASRSTLPVIYKFPFTTSGTTNPIVTFYGVVAGRNRLTVTDGTVTNLKITNDLVGIGTASPDAALTVQKDGTHSYNLISVKNTSNTNTAPTTINMSYGSGAFLVNGNISIFNNNFTTAGVYRKNAMNIDSNGENGISIGSSNATGIFSIYTGGTAASNEAVRTFASGNTSFGYGASTYTDNGYRVEVNGAVKATTFVGGLAANLLTAGQLGISLNEAPIVTIASSPTPVIGAAAANTINMTGNATVTGFDTVAAGIIKRIIFTGNVVLTYNITSMILPTAANITTNAGDSAFFVSLGGGNWKCISYTRANGKALVRSDLVAGDSIAGTVWGVANGLTATGTDQSTGLAITADINRITSSTAGSGVVLPVATSGRSITVINRSGNSIFVYPSLGNSLDALAANAPITLPDKGMIIYDAFNSSQWESTLNLSINASAINYTSQAANTFFAAPNGGTGLPTFRTIAVADIPTLNQNTTGTASNVTGIVSGANGGTGVNNGANTITLGGSLITSGTFNSTFTMTGTTSVVFPTTGTLATLSDITASNLSGVVSGDKGGTGVANTGKTITLGGNLTTSGAFASTFTMTGITAITFPTSGNLLSSVTAVSPITGTPSATTYLRGDGTWSAVAGGGGGTVTTVSVATANGFAGTVATATTTPVITLTTSVSGLLKGNGTAISAASAGSDYSAGTSGLATGIIKSTTGTGAFSIAVAGDFPTLNQNTTGTASNVTGVVVGANGGTGVANTGKTITLGGNLTTSGAFASTFTMTNTTAVTFPTSGNLLSSVTAVAAITGTPSASTYLRGDGTWSSISTGGTVTSVSVVSANGFAGTVATATTTPAITLSTSINGLVKGNGTALSAASSGVDYSAGTSALATGIIKSTTGTGTFSIAVAGDFPTLNQNTTGTAANVTGVVVGANGGTGVANTGKTITLGGNLTTSGAFASTFTMTNTTTVTFPVTGTLATLAGTETFSNKSLTTPAVTGTSYTHIDKGTVSTGTVTFDYSAGESQRLQVGGALTIALSNLPASGRRFYLMLELVNAGSAVVTLPTINWVNPDGTTTTTFSTYLANINRAGLQTTGTDFMVLWGRDAGTTTYGKLL